MKKLCWIILVRKKIPEGRMQGEIFRTTNDIKNQMEKTRELDNENYELCCYCLWHVARGGL